MTQAVTLSGLGSTNALYTDSSGNVGIGTSSPFSATGWKALSIDGTSQSLLDLRINGTSSAFVYASAASFNIVNTSATTPLVFQTNSIDRARIDSSGNVGIGTSSPQSRLDINTTASGNILNVQGASGASAEINISLTGGTGNAEAILNFGNNLTTAARYVGRIAYSTSNNYMVFWTNTTERMRIDASGRVTKPYQPAFAVNGGFSGARTANSILPFDSALLNTGNYFNTATSLFTAPVAGNYLFTVTVYVQGASSICYRINGAELGSPTPLIYTNAASSNDNSGSSQIIKYLSVGDTFGVYCRGTQASNVYGPHSMFCGYLLG